MNRYQRLVFAAAIINLLVVFLFPPFSHQQLVRGALPSFAGFFPVFTHFSSKPLHTELLVMEVIFIASNALAAWLALELARAGDFHRYRFGRGVGLFALASLAVILLFPPFETYNAMLRDGGGSFDSFYFVFGDRSARPIFAPLLYLECFFVFINALAIFLLFTIIERGESDQKTRLLDMASNMNDQELAQLSGSMRGMVEEHRAKTALSELGRHQERRRAQSPIFPGSDRRKHADRRRR